jgi:hypothetical protein
LAPVTKNNTLPRIAIDRKMVYCRTVGMAMDDLFSLMNSKRGFNRSLIHVHDSQGLLLSMNLALAA